VDRRGARQAVEHTTIDAYFGQRQDTARYRNVLVPLEELIKAEFPDSWIAIIAPAHAIQKGERWDVLGERIFGRLCETIRSMPIADHRDSKSTEFTFSDIPFPIWIRRQGLGGEEPYCAIDRVAPADWRDQMVAGIVKTLKDKSEQLHPYRSDEVATVLLIDFDEISLVNQDSVAESFVHAGRRELDAFAIIDEVYLVRWRPRGPWVFPVKLGCRLYPDLPEFQVFRRTQYEVTYGRKLAGQVL
jgi:hypothetical protein